MTKSNFNLDLRTQDFKLRLALPLIIIAAGFVFMPPSWTSRFASAQEQPTIVFAAIGDYGSNHAGESDVSNLVKSWNPDFIITLGDNNYPDGEASTIDANVGKYYREYIYPYNGAFGSGADTNKFWPCVGNRDWDNQLGTKLQPYLDYFTLPNNERYYDFVRGPVHFFVIDSDPEEPDGTSSTSIQAQWLRTKLAASTSPWKIVYLHHPPYSSRTSFITLQWPYQAWGANAVLSGHAHLYERVMKNGIPFITNGLGGESTGTFAEPIEGSAVRFGDDYGAMRIAAGSTFVTFEFITRTGVVIDSYTMGQQPPSAPSAPTGLTATATSGSQISVSWTDQAYNDEGFHIERCAGAGCTNFAQVGQATTNAINYPDPGLAATTLYRYRVRAFNSHGNSGYSNIAEATTTSLMKISAASYSVNENVGSVSVTVQRTGDNSGMATVNYATSDAASSNCNVLNSGNASSRCDYESTAGTLHFAAGESAKTILIPVIDDAYPEASESFIVTLRNPINASLGSPSVATVIINVDETATGTNPINQAGFFVRLHYVDFLNREPDAAGLAYWSDQINSCGTDSACVDLKRMHVSAAFFLSLEFQETGYLVERTYRAAYGNATGTSTLGGTHQLSVPVIRFNEFLPETQQLGHNVVVGKLGWETVLENNKRAYMNAFVGRARFTAAYPTTMSAAQYVDALNVNAGNALSVTERNQLVGELTSGTKTRAQVLRAVAEDPDLNAAEFNRAFVLMQFYGYLRRDPNEGPDVDYTGYDYWLGKLNQFGGNFVSAEMVKAFIVSGEYKQRFGP